jgi:glycosyltransferase involved in cell wall biosynthesis
MRIAFIGQKGIPAVFGGVEYHVEELAQRLVQRGHTVHVYVRPWYTDRRLRSYKGVRLVHTPTIKTKHLDAFLHSLTSSVHALCGSYDIVHYHALGPSVFCWLPKIFRRGVVITLHGMDWKRGKWGGFARAFLKCTERTAVYIPDRVIAVSREQQTYLEHKYKKKVIYLPNGVNMPLPNTGARTIAHKYGLHGRDYLLWLGRITPEKRVDWLVRAFREIKPAVSLVIAGGVDGPGAYERDIKREAAGEKHIIFTGFVGGIEKQELLSNALCFILPSYLEGLPIALLEAMSYGLVCLASDIPPHREIITPGVDGFLFRSERYTNFVKKLKILLAGGTTAAGAQQTVGKNAALRVKKDFNWDTITDQTEQVYYSIVKSRRCGSGRRARGSVTAPLQP